MLIYRAYFACTGRTLTFAYVALIVGLCYYSLPDGITPSFPGASPTSTSASTTSPNSPHAMGSGGGGLDSASAIGGPAVAPRGSASDALDAVQLRLNTLFSNAAFFMLMPYLSLTLYTADRRRVGG